MGPPSLPKFVRDWLDPKSPATGIAEEFKQVADATAAEAARLATNFSIIMEKARLEGTNPVTILAARIEKYSFARTLRQAKRR